MTTTTSTRAVDDTPDVRDLLTMAIGRAPGFEVVGQAGDGRQALVLAEQERPDAVLIDLAMPVMDGLEALPHLRRMLPDAALVVLSGFGAGAMAGQAREAGADDYVEKGTPIKVVVQRLRDALAARRPEAAGTPPTGHTGPPVPPPTTPPVEAADPTPAAAPSPDDEIARLRRALATTAHEVRNPVTVLRGVAEALAQGPDRVDRQRHARLVEAVARQARILEGVANDLMAAASAQRGGVAVAPEVVDLGPAVRELLATTAPDVHLDVPDEPVGAFVDRARLEQMVANLCENARKYGAAPTTLRLRPAGDRVELSVADRGEGVPPAFRDQLFREFSRGEAHGDVPGIGLGLYVVRRLAEAHGGTVRYDDEPGGGACFTVDLPRARPPRPAVAPSAEPTAAPATSALAAARTSPHSTR